jgi:hypothetical protein
MRKQLVHNWRGKHFKEMLNSSRNSVKETNIGPHTTHKASDAQQERNKEYVSKKLRLSVNGEMNYIDIF